jgi:putative PIN family toxin of toxin-antitoxin system
VAEFGITADTNVYISALEFGGLPLEILTAARQRRIRLDISPALREEIGRILVEKFGWSSERVQALHLRLARFTTMVHTTITIDAVPEDPDDNKVLECAVTARSSHIVTGDNALLRPGRYQGIPIVRVADFLRML